MIFQMSFKRQTSRGNPDAQVGKGETYPQSYLQGSR